MHRRLLLGAGDAVNYEFHENLTPEKIDELIDGIKKKEQQ